MKPESIGSIDARNVFRCIGLDVNANPAMRTRWEQLLVKTWGAGERDPWEVGDGRCKACACEIDATPVSREVAGAVVTLPATVCEDCMAIAREHYNGEDTGNVVSMTPKWDENCPLRFREVIDGMTAFPAIVDRDAFKRVTSWRPGDGKGLALVGEEGSGKSLSFWSLARELERETVSSVTLSGVELGRVLARAARDIESVEWLCNCRVLMVDDLGKEKATPAVGALLWEVLDARYQRKAPMVITTRFSGEAMRDRFSEPHLGDDIRRRLNELCRAVKFERRIAA